MTKGEWSGWMQAVGSLVALGIAIAVPYVLYQQGIRDRLSDERAAAELVLRNIKQMLRPTIGLLTSIENRMSKHGEEAFTLHFVNVYLSIVNGLPYTNESRILMIGKLWPQLALMLVEASALQQQFQVLMQTMKTQYDFGSKTEENQRRLAGNILSNCLKALKAVDDSINIGAPIPESSSKTATVVEPSREAAI